MREIKFRAWDSVNHKIVTSGLAINLDTTGRVIPVSFSQGDLSYCRDNDVNKVPNVANEIQIMQYTGLKDKNGVEIYEGDILGKHPYGYLKSDGSRDGRYKGKEWDCFVVEWGEHDPSELGLVGGYEYEVYGKYAGWNIIVGGYDSDLDNYSVIGNIYEHPELLEANQ